MQHQVPNPTHIFKAFPAALQGGAVNGIRDDPPPEILAVDAPGRNVNRNLAPWVNLRVFTGHEAGRQRDHCNLQDGGLEC